MKRRNFLHKGFMSSLPLLFSFQSTTTAAENSLESNLTPDFYHLEETTIAELERRLDNGEIDSVGLLAAYLIRIREIDNKKIGLHSIISINPDASEQARTLDKERLEGKKRSPLHGIPVLIKDNIDTLDQMPTTAGSLALTDNYSDRDAFIIQKLRAAGAIILGKTNLSEWANFRSTRSSSGWSSYGGQTLNPYILTRTPCGSSSGSAVAVASNLCTLAIGTETNGSIACPAAVSNVIGIKPTVGLWSRSGIIPISYTQDTAGPIARTVRDAALMLGLLAGFDESDQSTQSLLDKDPINYTDYCRSTDLSGIKIGVEKSYLKVHEGVDLIMQNAIRVLKNCGAEIIEVNCLKIMDELWAAETIVLEYEFKQWLNAYLARAKTNIKSLNQLIDYNSKNSEKVMPYFKQEILESAMNRGNLDSEEYKSALTKLVNTAQIAIDNVIDHHQLAAIFGPTNGPAWCIDWINGDFFGNYATYSLPAVAGYPHITVPAGYVGPLPFGITFLAKAWMEPQLIQVAYAFEQSTHHRKPPLFIDKME